MRVHQFKPLVFWCPDAKKALAFPKNSFSFSRWRTRLAKRRQHHPNPTKPTQHSASNDNPQPAPPTALLPHKLLTPYDTAKNRS